MEGTTYTVKAGDTLSRIASQYGVGLDKISGYKSGDPNKIGVGEVLKIGTTPPAPVNTINAANLGGTALKTPAPAAPLTGYDALIAGTDAAIANLTPKVTEGAADIKAKYDRLGELPEERADAYKKEGVYDKQAAYQKEVNNIKQKEVAYLARVDKIRNSNPTGALEAGQNIELDRVSKDWAIEKAALTISAAFLQDDYTLAKSIVDDRVKAETEGLEQELEGLKFFYSENSNTLSDEKKNRLEFQIQQIEDEKAEKESLLSSIGEIQMEAASNGAPSSTIVAIGKSPDVTSAITAAGNYIGLLERQKEARIAAGDGSGGGSGTVALTPDDKRNLIGGGWTEAEIGALPAAIAASGIDAVLNAPGMSDAKRLALKKVYGMDTKTYKTRADAEAKVNELGVDKVLSTVYGMDELKQFADATGSSSWWKPKGVDVGNYYKTDAAKQKAIDLYIQKWTRDGEYKQ